MDLASAAETTASKGTSQNREILRFMEYSRGSAALATITSGWIPMERSSLTECCVGFVFCSPTVPSMGTNVVWTKRQFCPLPISVFIWRTASRKGMLSMSPTVPPSSTMHTSAPEASATFLIRCFISLVM
ncbi:MAG: hypothetical protein A4E31_01274 [Methanomassiliicoccales archaeon PtaU1.Bin030]|nr:MAG: hypothetical protein A4E31_01274 [Methanomassiliicoccales archaeon PtaU1.Bin030]